MILDAHWGYWLGLALALVAGGLELARRIVLRRRVWLAAFLEQARREKEHRGPRYRPDQTVRAIQQRLSRHIGKRAFSDKTRLKIARALGLAD